MIQAPWKDFNGNEIHEGDTISHPSGESGRVVFLAGERDPSDQWRVDYGASELSRLCLQIGDRGRAVVAELNKAANDLLVYGVGAVSILSDGSTPKHIPLRDIMK